MSEPKTIIPRFASFRPKSVSPGSIAPKIVEEKEYKRRTKDKPSVREDRKYRDQSRRSTSRVRDHKHGLALEDVEQPRLLHPGDELPEIFIVDRKGDINNLIYGSIHRYSVPSFHRSGAGGVLGAPSHMKIDRNNGDVKSIVLSDRTHLGSNLRERYVFSKIGRDKPRLLRIRREVVDEPFIKSEADFIPLQATRRKKRKRGDAEDSSGSERDEADYRSIHGKIEARTAPVEEGLQYATDSDTSSSEADGIMKLDLLTREKTAYLSRKLEDNPHDIDTWISLIEHQDTIIRSKEDHRRITNAEIRSIADIKIHIYEKALGNAKSSSDRERLLLGLMYEGSKVWEIKTQSEKWEQISKDNIDSLLLWKSYLAFKQTTFSTFRYEEVKGIFTKRMKLLMDAISRASPGRGGSLYQQLIYVILRLTLYVREAGYSELGVAIWQGILEYNFFAPNSTEPPMDKIALFRAFWESEVPRIGEADALGWNCFAENQNSSEPPEPVKDEALCCLLDARNIFKSWATSERVQAKFSRFPSRTMDEVAEDDPFRVILVSDIEDYLVSLPLTSMSVRRTLLNAFLIFCRLPPIADISDEVDGTSSCDPFIEGNLLECLSIDIRLEGKTGVHSFSGDTEADIRGIFETPVTKFVSSSESMFTSGWFKSLRPWKVYYSGDNGPVSYMWVRAALQKLTQASFCDDLGEYYLSFEWRNEPDTIKKVSKSLLKQHPSSLKLYNSYGMIEWARGNKEVANGVFSATLNMSKTMPGNDGKLSVLLWKSWVWAYLGDADNDMALQRLLTLTDGSPNVSVAAATLLKAKQHLSSTRDYFLSSGDTGTAVIYAECLALLDYVSARSASEPHSHVQGDINTALSTYSSFSQLLINRKLASSIYHELLLQSAARLLCHHARIGPFRPALLREHLTNFLTLFPQNTIFLSLYAFNESRLRIDNRVRAILHSTILIPKNDTLASRLFAIHFEIVHGTIHSVRSAFENALSSPATKSSAALWRFYIIYCLRTPQFCGQIKDIWYRALRACPWAKELYVLGFETLEGLVDFGDLKGTWRVMGEKELRVHIDLEDKFDEIGELENKYKEAGKIKSLELK